MDNYVGFRIAAALERIAGVLDPQVPTRREPSPAWALLLSKMLKENEEQEEYLRETER